MTIVEKQNFFYRNRYVLLAFLVPFVLMALAFAAAGFYPFGDNQVAVIDMYHQYFPFLSELHEKLQTGGNLLYSWNGALGTNFFALISYYAASPLYLLTLLFPQAYLMEAMTLVLMIKIGLAGMFMCIYLRGLFGKCDIATVAFSAMYALCAFVMGYYWCLMWLDAVALLPLCILGLNAVIDHGRFKLYVISLALMMITNFYIGAMACMFILVYYPILYFSRREAKGAKLCAQTTGKAVLFSGVAILIAAVILLPTLLNMQNTYYIDSTMPEESSFYNPILDVLTNLLPGVPLTVREGLPNIYCGLLSVLLFVFYLLCRRIPLKQKLLNCGLLAFLVLSFNWNKLDFIWHGLHFPNQLPYRFSFVFSFVLITLAYQAFLSRKELTLGKLGAIAAGGFIYIILAQKLYADKFSPEFAYIALLFLFVYGGILALHRVGKLRGGLFCLLIFIAVFAEMANHAALSVDAVDSTKRSEYFSNYDEVTDLIKKARKTDDGFYRVELANRFTLNGPALYHYPGVSQFSSTVNGKMSYLMDQIGLEAKDVKNRYNYVMTNPVINAMLNVKYIIGKGISLSGEDSLELAGGKGLSTLYRNKYDLSAGYMVNSGIEDWDYGSDNPFTVLNGFIQSAAGVSEPVFINAGEPAYSGTNAQLGAYGNGTISCTAKNTGQTSDVQLKFKSQKNQQMYIYVESDQAESITAAGQNGNPITLQEDCGAIVSVGKCKAGETVTVNIHYPAGETSNITAYGYGMDEITWNEAYGRLNDETWQITEHSDTMLKGKLAAKRDGYMVTSIPYEKGWTVTVDGKTAEPELFGGAMIMLPISAGTHEVELHYLPDGLIPGILITLCGIGIFIALCFVFRRPAEVPLTAPASRDKELGVKRARKTQSKRWRSGLHRRRYW